MKTISIEGKIAKRLLDLSAKMVRLGLEMDSDGLSKEMKSHGKELLNAERIIRGWARGIEEEEKVDAK